MAIDEYGRFRSNHSEKLEKINTIMNSHRYIKESYWRGIKNMINFSIFIEGLLMPLLGLGVFVVYKRSKRKKRKFHAPPTHQLPS